MVPLGYWSKLMTILVVFQFSFPGPCGFGMTWSIRVHIRTFKEWKRSKTLPYRLASDRQDSRSLEGTKTQRFSPKKL
jgi:hypothetical protein